MSLNILAKVGTTIQSMTVTAITATTIRIIGYISDPTTLRRVSRDVADLLVQLQEHAAHLAGDLARLDDLDPVVLEDVRVAPPRRR